MRILAVIFGIVLILLVAHLMRADARRESFLSYLGPLSLLALFAFWAVLFVFGFALLLWGLAFWRW